MATPSPYVSERIVAAAPKDVAAAIASPYGLSTWYCDDAKSEKRPDGRLTLAWYDGRQASGRWKTYAPPNRLAWTVRMADGGEQIVAFTLTPEGEGTRISLAVEGPADHSADRWEHALADLVTYVETGRNDRSARRPMLGIYPDFNATSDDAPEGEQIGGERSSAEGSSGEQIRGVRIGGAVSGGGAEAAGITAGDVLRSIAGKTVTEWGSIGNALDGHVAGETVDIVIWRDGAEQVVPLTLGSRPQPDVPEGADAIARWIESETDSLIERLADTLEGIGPDEAEFRPGEGEWNVRQVLGHLIVSERFNHVDIMLFGADVERAGWPGSPETRLQNVLARQSLDTLRSMLYDHLRESAAMARDILADDQRPPIARGLAEGHSHTDMHVQDHIGQIKANVAAAREQAIPV